MMMVDDDDDDDDAFHNRNGLILASKLSCKSNKEVTNLVASVCSMYYSKSICFYTCSGPITIVDGVIYDII